MKIGITERGDAAVHFEEWLPKLNQVDGAILITKNPGYLLKHWNDFDHKKCIIHCTVTGWGGTWLEPHVPTPGNALWAYWKITERADHLAQIVLRIDPIIPTKAGIKKARRVFLAQRSLRVRTSIMDFYPHVQKRLANWRSFQELLQLQGGDIHLPVQIRKDILSKIFGEARIEICGEPGLPCTGCVSSFDLAALNLTAPKRVGKSKQREACTCLSVKTELLSNRRRCKHECAYCYWR